MNKDKELICIFNFKKFFLKLLILMQQKNGAI